MIQTTVDVVFVAILFLFIVYLSLGATAMALLTLCLTASWLCGKLSKVWESVTQKRPRSASPQGRGKGFWRQKHDNW